MNQALEYKEMIENSKLDKTMEFMPMWNRDHPLVALRAYECNEYAKTERFRRISAYIHGNAKDGAESVGDTLKELPMTESSKYYLGKSAEEVVELLSDLGYTNIQKVKTTQKGGPAKSGQVVGVLVDGHDGFNRYEWYPTDVMINVEFFEPETQDEVAAAHPGQLRMPDSAKKYLARTYEGVAEELQAAGFTNISLECQRKGKKGWMSKEGAISKISVNGQTRFEKGEWFAMDARIQIAFYSYENSEELEVTE